MRTALSWVAAALTALGQAPPPDLLALVSKAGLEGPVAAWCRGEFQSGGPAMYAVAVPVSSGGGRYLVLNPAGRTVELAAFARSPDLSCYSKAEADRLNRAIGQSLTIEGSITPRWSTALVCGFVDDTTAVCWQRSPADGVFVTVGGWTT